MSRFDTAIAIAADSVATLRRPDVFRVLDHNGAEMRGELADYISTSRPDLAAEVADVMAEEFA